MVKSRLASHAQKGTEAGQHRPNSSPVPVLPKQPSLLRPSWPLSPSCCFYPLPLRIGDLTGVQERIRPTASFNHPDGAETEMCSSRGLTGMMAYIKARFTLFITCSRHKNNQVSRNDGCHCRVQFYDAHFHTRNAELREQ